MCCMVANAYNIDTCCQLVVVDAVAQDVIYAYGLVVGSFNHYAAVVQVHVEVVWWR